MKNPDVKKIVIEQIKEILAENEEEKPKYFTIDQINKSLKEQTAYDIKVLKDKISRLEKILNCEHEWVSKNYPQPNRGEIRCTKCGAEQNTKIPEKTGWDGDGEGDWM